MSDFFEPSPPTISIKTMIVFQFQLTSSLKKRAPVARSDKSVRKRMSDPIGMDANKGGVESQPPDKEGFFNFIGYSKIIKINFERGRFSP